MFRSLTNFYISPKVSKHPIGSTNVHDCTRLFTAIHCILVLFIISQQLLALPTAACGCSQLLAVVRGLLQRFAAVLAFTFFRICFSIYHRSHSTFIIIPHSSSSFPTFIMIAIIYQHFPHFPTMPLSSTRFHRFSPSLTTYHKGSPFPTKSSRISPFLRVATNSLDSHECSEF